MLAYWDVTVKRQGAWAGLAEPGLIPARAAGAREGAELQPAGSFLPQGA